MLPVINIGPLALPAPELILLVGFWIGLDLTERQAERYRVNPAQVYHLALIGIIAGLVGARLAYAARAPEAFLASPLNLLSPRPEMLDGVGGLAGAAAGALIFLWIRKLPLWSTLDAITTLLAVLAVSVGVAHFASGDAFGAPSNVPWAINLWGERRHPAQVYEVLAGLAIAAITWAGGRVASMSEYRAGGGQTDRQPGMRFWVLVTLSAGARLALEAFRGDSTLVLGMFRQAQLIAWLVVAIGLWQVGRRLKSPALPEGENP